MLRGGSGRILDPPVPGVHRGGEPRGGFLEYRSQATKAEAQDRPPGPRGVASTTLSSSLGEVLGVGGAEADDPYAALDWLAGRQRRIEKKLAERHLAAGPRVLWDF